MLCSCFAQNPFGKKGPSGPRERAGDYSGSTTPVAGPRMISWPPGDT